MTSRLRRVKGGKDKMNRRNGATTLVGGSVLAALVLAIVSSGNKSQEVLVTPEAEWREATERGIEPYVVRGIDQFSGSPYTIEYMNLDGDSDFDIARWDDGSYGRVNYEVADVERASR